MQVLKFGGSSVANAGNINKSVQVIQQAIKKDKTIVVVSAFGGITDNLLQCGSAASAGDESYKDSLNSSNNGISTRCGNLFRLPVRAAY